MNSLKASCLIAIGSISILAGCKTIDPTSVSNFASSVSAVKTQADQALNTASTLTLTESVAFAAQKPTLQESNFVQTPTVDTISQWDNSLSAIEAYAQNLSSILSPNAVTGFDTAATNL